MAFVPQYILILFFVIAIDYASGRAMENTTGRRRKAWLLFSLASNILILGFFKYFGFLNQNMEWLGSLLGFSFKPVNLHIILPIGLSFHTFQSMSYSIEVYKGTQKTEKHLGHFANYVLFFPQMVAGPIERYGTLGNELKQEHKPLYENLSNGFRLILFGLLIKMCVADNLAPFVNKVYENPASFSSYEVWLAVFMFSFQIYADFSGYSAIALGCARMMGIRIMENFRTPYFSRSIGEFWTRWHISLSTWFRDYVYIPLGGSKVSLWKLCFNVLLVFMVSGMWHGASWTFVAWGACHGLLRILEVLLNKITGFKIKEGWSLLNILLTLKTFLLTSIFWIFFRAESFQKAADVFTAMFSGFHIASGQMAIFPLTLFVALLFVTDLLVYNSRFDVKLSSLNMPLRWTVYGCLLFCLMALAGTQKLSFIYFQF